MGGVALATDTPLKKASPQGGAFYLVDDVSTTGLSASTIALHPCLPLAYYLPGCTRGMVFGPVRCYNYTTCTLIRRSCSTSKLAFLKLGRLPRPMVL